MHFKRFIASAFTLLALLSFPYNVDSTNNAISVDDNIIIETPIDDGLILFSNPPKPW